jgi:hypothetical protein
LDGLSDGRTTLAGRNVRLDEQVRVGKLCRFGAGCRQNLGARIAQRSDDRLAETLGAARDERATTI